MRARLRMGVNRPWMTVSLRLPVDVVQELQEVAPMLGWSRYETLMRCYIGDGLRKDLQRLDGSLVASLTDNLRKQGVPDEKIAAAIAETGLKMA
jgi:hypothetical protein